MAVKSITIDMEAYVMLAERKRLCELRAGMAVLAKAESEPIMTADVEHFSRVAGLTVEQY